MPETEPITFLTKEACQAAYFAALQTLVENNGETHAVEPDGSLKVIKPQVQGELAAILSKYYRGTTVEVKAAVFQTDVVQLEFNTNGSNSPAGVHLSLSNLPLNLFGDVIHILDCAKPRTTAS